MNGTTELADLLARYDAAEREAHTLYDEGQLTRGEYIDVYQEAEHDFLAGLRALGYSTVRHAARTPRPDARHDGGLDTIYHHPRTGSMTSEEYYEYWDEVGGAA